MNRIAFAVPGDLATPTGGYGYDRRIIAELQVLGWQIDVVSLGDGFPQPSAEQRAVALARLEALPEGIPVVVDGLALGALPEAAEKIARRAPLIALVHHPLALEAGLSSADAQKLFESERKALAAARSVIVTSRATAKRLNADYDVPPERITVAPPGTDRAAPAKGSVDGTLRLLSVGAVVPRKGFDVLIAALASIPALPWRLTIAGDLTRSPPTAAKLQADIARHRLAARVDLLGAVSPQQLARAVFRGRCFRAGIALRGLWHGLRGGDGARSADHRHDGRRDRGHGARDCRRAGRAREREGADARAADGDRKRGRAAAACARCTGRGSRLADLGEHGADRRERARAARMSGFSAEWLELREPYDLRARNAAVLDAVFNLLAGQPSVALVDLACGTGSTFRALSPRISARQTWRLVDNDLSLLARVPPSSSPSINVTAVPIDLNRDLEAAFDSAADLITTSALLDLVSDDWLNRLARRSCRAPLACLCSAEL